MKHLTFALFILLASGCGNTSPTNPATAEKPAISSPAPAAKPADEAAAIQALAEVNKAQADYFKRNRRYALAFDELIDAHVLTAEPSNESTGYDFKMRPAADAGSYSISANPVSPAPGARHLFTDQTGTIHAEQDKDATAASPKIS